MITHLHPAYLFIGPYQQIREQAELFLKKALCHKHAHEQAYTLCATCLAITQRQHSLVRWITPEHTYSIALIDEILRTLTLSLQHHEHFFFVLDCADRLSSACANRLLKSLEEPPPGYHFILLTPRQYALLPTIRSRCVAYYSAFNQSIGQHALMRYLTNPQIADYKSFISELDHLKLTEEDALDIIDNLIAYFKTMVENALFRKKAYTILDILEQAYHHPPMAGSTKIYLKNIFLQIRLLMVR